MKEGGLLPPGKEANDKGVLGEREQKPWGIVKKTFQVSPEH